jgi:membrane-bound serine protease (ClpP class)
MQPMIWPALLLLLGLFFIVLELFVPSGGVLALLAGASVLASIYVGFTHGLSYGLISVLLALVFVPAIILLMIKMWPRTPLGRLIFLRPPSGDDEVLPMDEEYRERKGLVGKFGVAKSKMLPSGAVVIEGRTYDAVSRGNPIEPGETIRVISVTGNRIVVAPADPQQAARAAQAAQSGDVLSQPIDSLGLEPFDEPLT